MNYGVHGTNSFGVEHLWSEIPLEEKRIHVRAMYEQHCWRNHVDPEPSPDLTDNWFNIAKKRHAAARQKRRNLLRSTADSTT